jgi:non-specific serine/threonine protein kinase
MVEELPDLTSRNNRGVNNRYPTWMAKSILRQVLQGLVFLHEQGIVHGDIQPGNVLFSVRSLSSYTLEELEQDINDREGISQPVERPDGKMDLWAPNYLVEPQSLADYAIIEPGFTVKLSDMGSGKYTTFWYSSSITFDLHPIIFKQNSINESFSFFHCRSARKSLYPL